MERIVANRLHLLQVLLDPALDELEADPGCLVGFLKARQQTVSIRFGAGDS